VSELTPILTAAIAASAALGGVFITMRQNRRQDHERDLRAVRDRFIGAAVRASHVLGRTESLRPNLAFASERADVLAREMEAASTQLRIAALAWQVRAAEGDVFAAQAVSAANEFDSAHYYFVAELRGESPSGAAAEPAEQAAARFQHMLQQWFATAQMVSDEAARSRWQRLRQRIVAR
jgi:hypothetical protein